MAESALLIEKLADATGLARDTIREVVNTISTSLAKGKSNLRQRVSGIMASNSSLDSQFDEVVTVTEDNIDVHTRSRIAAGLGLGFLGGFVLAGATTAIATLAGIVLILMAGFMVADMMRIALNRLKASLDAFSF